MKTKVEKDAGDNLDGILFEFPRSNDPIAYPGGYDTLDIIENYENKAREILKAGNYPLTVREIMQSQFDKDGVSLGKAPLPRKIRDAMEMLQYFHMVRVHIKENDILFAVGFMAFGVHAAQKLHIRPLKPFIGMGKSLQERQKKSLETREIKKKIIRETIRRIFEKYPNLEKTLGKVWHKFDHVNKGMLLFDEFYAEIGMDAQRRPIIIIKSKNGKLSEYKKRSLQHFIDELKYTPSCVTQ